MPKRFPQKTVFFVLLLASFALILTGCGKKGAEVADKKTLIYATASDATRLDPQMMTDVPSYNPMSGKVYETLIGVGPKGELYPLLATEWKNLTPLSWELKLRPNVKFHDGALFNAEAAKKSLDRLMDPQNKKSNYHILKDVASVEVVDEYTIKIMTKTPFPALIQNLSHTSTGMISPQAIANQAEKPLDQNPVGTGPFKLEKWVKGEGMTLVQFSEYWGKKPAIEKLVFKVVPEDSTRMGMVQSGEAQIADKAPFNDVERYEKDGRFAIIRTAGYGTEFLGINLKKEKFQDIRVRKAINLGIDRKAILSGVYQNIGEPGVSTLSPMVFGYNPNLPASEYNPAKAKELLKEAGVPDLRVTLWTSTNNKARLKMAEIIQAQLKEAGITVDIKTLEWGTYLQAHHDGETELYIMGWSNSSGDAGASLINWTQEGFGNSNGSFYTNPEVEELMRLAAQEMDPVKREQLYWKVQEITTADEVRFVSRVNVYVSLANKNVEGIAYTPTEILIVDNLVIK